MARSTTCGRVALRGDAWGPAYTGGMAEIDRLLEIMAQLRNPVGGCPWDLEQDFASISPHTIEEAYEVDDAIERGDLVGLRDELGDLLFQVVFQARIAEERGLFDFEGVVESIVEKLVRRHPHVFREAEMPGTRSAHLATWEELKEAERAAKAAAEGGAEPASPDPFEGIPRRLPALSRSAKIAGRMRRLQATGEGVATEGAYPSESAGLVARIETALASWADVGVEAELESRGSGRRDEAMELIGRGLQAWAELAREAGVDPEQALRQADDARMSAAREALDAQASSEKAHQGGNRPTR